MARKVRRVRKTGASSSKTSTKSSVAEEQVNDLQEEYAYVLQDLRQMFILAAAMFLLLIALNLVI